MSQNVKRLTLCATKDEPQCPVVEIRSRAVIITDDFGGRVRMTKKQFNLLLQKGQETARKR
ncbi:MAG: hypothetical protein AAB490_00505 [Patescibacteria group bacterium]